MRDKGKKSAIQRARCAGGSPIHKAWNPPCKYMANLRQV